MTRLAALVALAALASGGCDAGADDVGTFDVTVSGSGVQAVLSGSATVYREPGVGGAVVLVLHDPSPPGRTVSVFFDDPAVGTHVIGDRARLRYVDDALRSFVGEGGTVQLARAQADRLEGTVEAGLRRTSGEPTPFVVSGTFRAVRSPHAGAP